MSNHLWVGSGVVMGLLKVVRRNTAYFLKGPSGQKGLRVIKCRVSDGSKRLKKNGGWWWYNSPSQAEVSTMWDFKAQNAQGIEINAI